MCNGALSHAWNVYEILFFQVLRDLLCSNSMLALVLQCQDTSDLINFGRGVIRTQNIYDFGTVETGRSVPTRQTVGLMD